MTTRDAYVALLEKRAASEGDDVLHESISPNNSYTAAEEEHKHNQEDHRAYLHSVFSNASAVQDNQSAELKKMFSNLPKNTSSSNPLIKIAFRDTFFGSLAPRSDFLKTASPIHLEVFFHAFIDELEKIAGFSPAKVLPDVSRAALRVGPHPTTGSPALLGRAAAGPEGMHPYRSSVSHANPVARPVTANPQQQSGLGVGSVQW